MQILSKIKPSHVMKVVGALSALPLDQSESPNSEMAPKTPNLRYQFNKEVTANPPENDTPLNAVHNVSKGISYFDRTLIGKIINSSKSLNTGMSPATYQHFKQHDATMRGEDYPSGAKVEHDAWMKGQTGIGQKVPHTLSEDADLKWRIHAMKFANMMTGPAPEDGSLPGPPPWL